MQKFEKDEGSKPLNESADVERNEKKEKDEIQYSLSYGIYCYMLVCIIFNIKFTC